MGLKGDDIALYLSGQPVMIKSCNVMITQPSLRQIVVFGENAFLTAANFLGEPNRYIEKIREANQDLDNYNDFQIFMAFLKQDESLRKSIQKFFKLTFPEYNIDISEEINFFHEDKKVGMVNPFNMEDFCGTIKNLFLLSQDMKKAYNPANKKAKEIAEKLNKGKAKVQSKKGIDIEKMTIIGNYTSILSIGQGYDLNTLYTYTLFQIHNLFIRY